MRKKEIWGGKMGKTQNKLPKFDHYLEIYMSGMNETGLKEALRIALGDKRDNDFLIKAITEWGVQHTQDGN